MTLLIEKLKPAWQAGKLNGVGGKIEPGETPEFAMSREFYEETGIANSSVEWKHCVTLEGADFRVYFFVSFGSCAGWFNKTAERVVPVLYDALPANVIPNLRWIIPLCCDSSVQHPIVVLDRPR